MHDVPSLARDDRVLNLPPCTEAKPKYMPVVVAALSGRRASSGRFAKEFTDCQCNHFVDVSPLVGIDNKDDNTYVPVGHPKSFPPLPNPRCTAPLSASGSGDTGPSAGPATDGRADRKAAVLSGGEDVSSCAGEGAGRGSEVRL